jgi:DNA-binding response OmpR family regulator
MDVLLVNWPEEEDLLHDLRGSFVPRLLLVHEGAPAPRTPDPLEDWARRPIDEDEIRARLETLAARAEQMVSPPVLDEGLLRFRGRWVALSPIEQALVEALVRRFGAVVERAVLEQRAWPDGECSHTALRVQVVRLRRRIQPLGLEIRTVRARGYLLQRAGDDLSG